MIRRLLCEVLYGGHVFAIKDDMELKQCLACDSMQEMERYER